MLLRAARRSHKGFGSGGALPDPRFEELTQAPRTAGKQRPGRESPRVRDSGGSWRRWSPWERQHHLLMDRWWGRLEGEGARDVFWGLCRSSWGDGGAPTAAGRTEVFLDTVSELCLRCLTQKCLQCSQYPLSSPTDLIECGRLLGLCSALGGVASALRRLCRVPEALVVPV